MVRLSVLLPLFLCPALAARDYWLIEHATILADDPGAPRLIEDGTIVVRDGLILAIGAGQAIELPPDIHLAASIDARGLLAHPAYIDAFTEAGITSPSRRSLNEDQPPDTRGGPLIHTRRGRRDGVRPEASALEAWTPSDEILSRYRRRGFGACLIAEGQGFLPGRTALVSLRGGPLRDAVIIPAHSQLLRFSRSRGGYPNSLMGAVAYMRQTFHDAVHHRTLLHLYGARRRGLPRPPRDTSLEALAAVLDGSMPLLIDATTTTGLRRARRFGAEFGLDVIAVGAGQAHRIRDWLAATSMPLVVTPDFREKPKPERKVGSLPPRVQAEQLDDWQEEVSGPARLREANVSFAFGSGARGDPDRLMKDIAVAAENGLGWSAALRALSLGAAELLGVADVVGSLEEGKAAHIVLRTIVRDGDRFLLDEKSRVRYLFVDGVRFEFEVKKNEKDEPAKKEQPGDDKAPPAIPGSAPRTELDPDRKPRLVTRGNLLIRGATVLTCAAAGDLEEHDILVAGGKIQALGPGLEAPEGTATLDASGWYVMPGIVDCHSHIAISGGVNESSQSITAEVRIGDVLNGQDLSLYRALAGGVTTSNILHGSANTIGGQNSVIRNLYGASPEDLLFPGAPPGVKFALGENPRQSNYSRRGSRFPRSRMGVEAVLRRSFAEAAEYRQRLADYAAALSRGERRLPPRRDLRVETLLEILEGRRVIHAHCYRADEILMLLGVSKDLGLRLATLQHVLEGYKVAPEIARAGVGGSTFSDWWAYKLEAFDAIPHNSALMARAGVVVSINSDDREMVRRLNQEAAKSVRSGGLGHQQALQLVTRNPALQLGILERVGTIEPGKDADLAIFDAHPLSVYARCRYTLIEGEVRFERRDDRRHGVSRPPPRPPRTEDLPEPPHSPDGVFALRGARVVPIGGAPIEDATVILEGGRIAAVGKRPAIAIPATATVLDLDGLHLYPGFIDCGTHLGLTEIGSVAGSVDSFEVGEAQPDLLTATAINAHSELLPVTRSTGVTAAAVFASGPVIAGQSCLVRMAGSTTTEIVFRDRLALHVDLPRVSRTAKEEPAQVKALEEWFARARLYFEQQKIAAREGKPGPARDRKLEALRPYAGGELPVVFSVDQEAQIRLALSVAERLKVRAVIRGGRDAWKLAQQIAAKKVPVIVGPVHSLPVESFDPYDAPYANAGVLGAAGVPIAFQTAHASLSCNLPYMAGTAVAYGLPHERALHALTLGAAEILGVASDLGSIEPGKRGDLIVTDGDPLEMTTRVIYVFIDGEPVSLESRHTRLYRQFRERLQGTGRVAEF